MDTSMLAIVRARLAAMRPSDFSVVAEASGVPIGTIRKIHYHEVDDPRFTTVQSLYDYFVEADRRKTPEEIELDAEIERVVGGSLSEREMIKYRRVARAAAARAEKNGANLELK